MSSISIGIVGLPNVGKSTLFQALTKKEVEIANYPFATIDPNVGVVEVPDERLSKLADFSRSQKVVPTVIEFVDIAGLVRGANKGEGLGNKFLSHIREVDAILEVVRVFEDDNIVHTAGSVDSTRDIGVIETELILADLQMVEKIIARQEKAAKTGKKDAKLLLSVAEPIKEALDQGKMASTVEFSPELEIVVRELQLLTSKPLIYVFNVSEDQLKERGKDIRICAKIEEELMDLSVEEAQEYLKDLGVESSGLDQLIHAAYDLLGLQTFFTAGPKECRAWTVQKGSSAPEAAGVIHTDFQKGFICAEVISYDDYVSCGSEAVAKAAENATDDNQVIYGKGSDAHKASVVGDTVGDPFKDTSGPSLNILIKLVSVVSVVFAGLIVKYSLAGILGLGG